MKLSIFDTNRQKNDQQVHPDSTINGGKHSTFLTTQFLKSFVQLIYVYI